MKVSEHFVLQEFIPKEIFSQYGENSIWFINPIIINVAEFCRDFFNRPIIINNWHTGGHFNESGYRLPDTTTGAKLSQHKRGAAIDIKIEGITDYEKIRQIVLANEKAFLNSGVTTMEDGTGTWLHIDCRFTKLDKILVVPFR